MYKFIIPAIVFLVPLIVAQDKQPVIPIITYNSEHNADGTYRFNYETGTGISQKEEGYIKNRGIEELEAQVMQGSYSYTDPDGQLITVEYIADENGFRPKGAHIHPSIAKLLEQIELEAAAKQSEG